MNSFGTQSWEHAIVEWLWAQDNIRINLPDKGESFRRGSYTEVVQLLTELGQEGWEVVTCAGVSNWLLWTLKRPSPALRSTGIAH